MIDVKTCIDHTGISSAIIQGDSVRITQGGYAHHLRKNAAKKHLVANLIKEAPTHSLPKGLEKQMSESNKKIYRKAVNPTKAKFFKSPWDHIDVQHQIKQAQSFKLIKEHDDILSDLSDSNDSDRKVDSSEHPHSLLLR